MPIFMFLFVLATFLGATAGVAYVFDFSKGAVLAVVELAFFLWWLGLVIISFNPNALHWRWFDFYASSNEKRWMWLAGFMVLIFFACTWVGRGDPLIRGAEEVIVEQAAPPVKTVGSLLYDFFENQIPDEWEPASPSAVGSIATAPRREPYRGLASWSHWFVFFLLYPTTVLIYGIFARREELLRWAEARLRARAMRQRTRRPGPAPAPTGPGAPAPTTQLGGRFYWIEGLMDVVAEVLGHILSTRYFTPRP